MTDARSTDEQFKRALPLEYGTIHVSVDDDDPEFVFIRENSGDSNRGVLVSVKEARALRDWLALVLL